MQRANPSHGYFFDILAKSPPREEMPNAPKEDAVISLAHEISRQQKTEDEFWTNRVRMENSMKDILDVYPSGSTIVEHILNMGRSSAATFIYFLDQVRQSHERAVHALLETERSQGSIYTERRLNLLEWNSGIHGFLKRGRVGSDDNERLEQAIDTIMEGLERSFHQRGTVERYCGMLLWDEDIRSTVMFKPASQELLSLDSAFRQWNSDYKPARIRSRLAIVGITEMNTCSWFAYQVVMCYTLFCQNRKSKVKIGRIKKTKEKLLRIKNGFKSSSIDKRLNIIEGSEDRECPKNWVRRIDDALERIDKDLISILESLPPDETHHGGISTSEFEEEPSLPDKSSGADGSDDDVGGDNTINPLDMNSGEEEGKNDDTEEERDNDDTEGGTSDGSDINAPIAFRKKRKGGRRREDGRKKVKRGGKGRR